MRTKLPNSTMSGNPPSRKAKKNTTLSTLEAVLQNVSLGRKHEVLGEPRSQGALRRIGVTKEDLETCPQITDSLVRAFGKINPLFGPVNQPVFPRKEIFNYIACSNDPDAQAFLKCYRGLARQDRDRVPIEAICIKSEVHPLKLFGIIVASAMAMKKQESALKTILNHPGIVDATLEEAKLPRGVAEKRMTHEAVGWLPTKQGSSIAINLSNPQTPKGDDDDGDEDERAFEEAFPIISGKLSEWSENRRALSEGKE